MRPAQVFISYRRDDAAGYARALCNELVTQFGAERVFIDVEDIDAGQPFSEVIAQQVGASQVLLVLIGRRWQGEREGAPPRISEPGDFVRREVAAGLANGARVIPVLLDGAPMPTESHLPPDLRALAGRNALELDNSRYAADINRLVASVREALGEPQSAMPRLEVVSHQGSAWGLASAVLVVGALAALWPWRMTGDAPPSERLAAAPDRPASAVAAARPDINGLWQAEVRYDWPNAQYVERFEFRGDATELHGTASFLRVPRGVLEGRAETGGVRFVTRTTEAASGSSADIVHRYQGRFVGDEKGGEIRFVMQTEGGSSPHAPVEFVARRSAPVASSAGR